VQARNSLPVLDPRSAVRLAIGFAQVGHEGASCNRDGVGTDSGCTCRARVPQDFSLLWRKWRKCLKELVAKGGIEPPTQGFSDR
jgi:hypothetical protein